MFEEWKYEGKTSFSFFSPFTLIGKYVQNNVISLFSFWALLFCWVLYIYIYITAYIQQRILYMLPLHNFPRIFWSEKKKERGGKRRWRRIDDTFWFVSYSLLLYRWSLSDHRDRLFMRSYKNIFLFLSLVEIFMHITEEKIVLWVL